MIFLTFFIVLLGTNEIDYLGLSSLIHKHNEITKTTNTSQTSKQPTTPGCNLPAAPG